METCKNPGMSSTGTQATSVFDTRGVSSASQDPLIQDFRFYKIYPKEFLEGVLI